MKPILLMLLASVASAQIRQDAQALLQKIVNTARATETWSSEMTRVLEFRGDKDTTLMQTVVKMTLARQSHARIEGSDGGVVYTCDGVKAWRFHPSLNSFASFPAPRQRYCQGFIPDWTNLLNGLRSAAIVGKDTVQFEGEPVVCDVIRAEYTPLPSSPPAIPLVRLLCVDVRRTLILWYVEERSVAYPNPDGSVSSVGVIRATTIYNTLKRDFPLPPDSFRFDPPPDSTIFSIYPLRDYYLKGQPPAESGLDTMPAWVLRTGNGVLAPEPVSRVAPEYTEEARRNGVQGKVTMLVWVSAEGVPELMRVTHSLDPGLDWNAIQAVRQWRFKPGEKNGKPVYTGISMDVDFRLP